MSCSRRPFFSSRAFVLAATLLCFLSGAAPLPAGPKPTSYWRVEDVRLPKLAASHDASVIAAAEVEL